MDDQQTLRVVIAEDNYLVREGLRRLLEDSGEIDVVASTGNATELLDAVRRLGPDAVLTDIRMPPGHHMEGIEADRKSTRLNSSHTVISYAVFCLKKKRNTQ